MYFKKCQARETIFKAVINICCNSSFAIIYIIVVHVKKTIALSISLSSSGGLGQHLFQP